MQPRYTRSVRYAQLPDGTSVYVSYQTDGTPLLLSVDTLDYVLTYGPGGDVGLTFLRPDSQGNVVQLDIANQEQYRRFREFFTGNMVEVLQVLAARLWPNVAQKEGK